MNYHQDRYRLLRIKYGVIRVGNARVTLDTIIKAYADGATPKEIARQYPVLSLAEVYSVISYYLRHRDDAEKYLQDRSIQHQKRE
jgi:uncharacterized protein (DUF433 family)